MLSRRYQLEEQIGSGGMGEVWRATDTLLSRPVAIKVLHSAHMADKTARTRFRTEARITAGLSHPGIAQVYDYGEQDHSAFLVMELVTGEPLSAVLKRGQGLEAGAALDILAQSAQALGAAHARGVVHRDIKPGNLLVTEDGTVKLTDFGIARGNESLSLTQTGMVMGTAQYISPEQASGSSATHASDIYSLGVVAYECLAGTPPFTSDTPVALALAHVREIPPPLPPHIPPEVRELVEGMLAKSTADRPHSSVEVARRAQRLRVEVSARTGSTTVAFEAAPAGGGAATALAGRGGDPGADPAETGPSPTSGGRLSDRLAEKFGFARERRTVLLGASLLVVLLGVAALWFFQGGSGGAAETSGGSQVSGTPEPTVEREEPRDEEEGEDSAVLDDTAEPQEQSQQQAPPAPEPEETVTPSPEPTPEETPTETEQPDPGTDDENGAEPEDPGEENEDSGEDQGE